MKHWLDVFRYELRQQLRSKGYLFFTFIVPLLVIAAFYGYQMIAGDDEDQSGGQDTNVNHVDKSIGYVDQTGLFPAPESYQDVNCVLSPVEQDAIRTLTGPDSTRREAIKRVTAPYCLQGAVKAFETVESGQDALEDDAIDVLYVIEPDYTETGNISVYARDLNFENQQTETWMQDYLIRSLLINVAADEYEPLYLRLRDPAFVTDHRITETGAAAKENESRDFIVVYGFGLLMIMSIFWGGGYLMQSVVQEKESRIIEIMLSSVRPTALLAGKVLAMGLLSVIQVFMLIGTFVFITAQAGNVVDEIGNIEIEPLKLGIMLVYFVLGFLLYGSLMAAIGAVSMSMRESQNFVVLITLPAMIPFFLITIFAEEPHSSTPVLLSMIPFTSPLSMTMRVAVTDVPAGEILLSLVLLVLGVALAIWMAGRMFRVNTLLAGNLPKLRDLPRLILRA